MKFLVVLLISAALISSGRSAPQSDDDDPFDSFEKDDDPGSSEVQADPLPAQAPAQSPVEAEPRILGASFGGSGGGQQSEPKHQHDHQSAPVPLEPFQQQQGGNSAGINQTCGVGSGRVCNARQNLVCDTDISPNRCKCKPNLSNLEDSFVYSPKGDKCYIVARDANHWTCDTDEQCTHSKLGRYSRCNSAHICECFDTEGHQRTPIRHEDVCYVKKAINEVCETDLECELSIPGNTVCLGLRTNTNVGLCQCASESNYHPLINECLKLGSINSTCKVDTQCNDPHALGSLAYCNLKTAKCNCKGIEHSLPAEAGYLDGKCYFIRGVNETCNSREECVLGYGKNAECQTHPAYMDEKICTCPPNKECSGNAFQVSVAVLAMGVVAQFLKSSF